MTENHMVLPYADDDAILICGDCERPLGRLGICDSCENTGADMLKLTRNKGEKIIITHEKSGEKIEITVCDVFRNWQVRLGIEADKTFLIDREEIHLDKMRGSGL